MVETPNLNLNGHIDRKGYIMSLRNFKLLLALLALLALGLNLSFVLVILIGVYLLAVGYVYLTSDASLMKSFILVNRQTVVEVKAHKRPTRELVSTGVEAVYTSAIRNHREVVMDIELASGKEAKVALVQEIKAREAEITKRYSSTVSSMKKSIEEDTKRIAEIDALVAKKFQEAANKG